MTTTRIRNASWAVAWDETASAHRYLRDADLVFTGNVIDFVGQSHDGTADIEIDGTDLVVLPGFVNTHAHPPNEPGYKGIREEHGVPEMYMTGLYERMLAMQLDDEGAIAGTEVAYAELLKSGVTTIVDLSPPIDGWLEVARRSGIRSYAGPWYASARWRLENRHQLDYDWDERAGRRAFDRAIEIIEGLESFDPSGRMRGILCAGQIDTVSVELFRDTVAYAEEHGIPLTTHCSQSVVEFHEMTRRHGMSPIQWAQSIGLLGPRTILGHGLFIDEHSWVQWHGRRDLDILVETGTSVAHCPTPFSRYGQVMQDFGRYVRAGVNMSIGTDTFPHNMLEEMRTAAVFARIAAEDINTLQIGDVFAAATVGGATALRRDDLGRLAPGAKADIVIVDGNQIDMRPLRDPLRSLIFSAADRAVKDVYVDGIKVVEDGKTLNLDPDTAVGILAEAQQRMERDCPNRDFAGRPASEIAPLSLDLM